MSSGPTSFDPALLRARRRRALALGAETFLLDRVAGELVERLAAVLRTFDRAADIGTPNDSLRRRLVASGKVADVAAIAFDDEALPFSEGSLDLVVSALALQFVNDLPGTLIQIRRALKPDGLLLAAMISGDSLPELREALSAYLQLRDKILAALGREKTGDHQGREPSGS